MDANFFYYSIYDRFIQIKTNMCVHACVHLLTFSLKKTSPQKPLTGLLPNFLVVFLRLERLKSFLHRYRKNQACRAIQALKRL